MTRARHQQPPRPVGGSEAIPDAGAADLPAQAEHLDRARTAQARVLVEDYAELISDLGAKGAAVGPSALARHLGVSHASVIKCIGRMSRDGLVTSLPYRGVSLTAEGHALAARVRRRHRVVVALLRAVGVPPADAAADAEGIEHHVSASTLAAFERFLEQDTASDAG